MDRQARLKGKEDWESYGAVCIIEAAKRHAAIINFREQSVLEFEVRDASEPETIYSMKIRKVVTYVCDNPRGDCSEYD